MAVAEHGRALQLIPLAGGRDRPRNAAATNTRPKITDRIEPGTPQTPATPAPGALPGAGAAQKVVLYEEDPADPNGKRFVGSAIWRTETVTPGPGQPPELAVRADVEVPERKLAMTWSFRRNTDKGLPATPYGRDHVQAAARISPRAASPTFPAS